MRPRSEVVFSTTSHGEMKRHEMKTESALSCLKEGEVCIVRTSDGREHEVRWSVRNWCFFHLERGAPVVCNAADIEEWWPASVKCGPSP
jgi:hypothetical protein